MKAFAVYNPKVKQILTDDDGSLLIYTSSEIAHEHRRSGEVVTEVEISMAMKSPKLKRSEG